MRFKCSILRKKVKKGSDLEFEEEEKDSVYQELDFLTPVKLEEVNESDTSNELEQFENDDWMGEECDIPDEEINEVRITRCDAFVGKTF